MTQAPMQPEGAAAGGRFAVPDEDGQWTLHLVRSPDAEGSAPPEEPFEVHVEKHGGVVEFFFGREDAGRVLPGGGSDESGLDSVDPSTHPSTDAAGFRRILGARRQLDAAEQGLRDAVAAARAAGDSWTAIGAAMGTTRQGAFQRFRATSATTS